jgi:hypothetical protein
MLPNHYSSRNRTAPCPGIGEGGGLEYMSRNGKRAEATHLYRPEIDHLRSPHIVQVDLSVDRPGVAIATIRSCRRCRHHRRHHYRHRHYLPSDNNDNDNVDDSDRDDNVDNNSDNGDDDGHGRGLDVFEGPLADLDVFKGATLPRPLIMSRFPGTTVEIEVCSMTGVSCHTSYWED